MAGAQSRADVYICYISIAPAIIFVALAGVFKGWFLGHGHRSCQYSVLTYRVAHAASHQQVDDHYAVDKRHRREYKSACGNISLTAINVLLLSLLEAVDAILQGLGRLRPVLINIGVGGALKILIELIFVPKWGIAASAPKELFY